MNNYITKKTSNRSFGTISYHKPFLWIGLLASLTSAAFGQTLVNANFEDPVLVRKGANDGPFYTEPHGNLVWRNEVLTSNIPGWTFVQSEGDRASGMMNAAGGAYVGYFDTDGYVLSAFSGQSAFIEQLGWMSQSVTFEAGTYTLSFVANGWGRGVDGVGQTLSITLNGIALQFGGANTVVPTTGAWTLYTSDHFTVGAGTHTLKIEGVVDLDRVTGLDNFSLTAVPEPSTMGFALMALSAGIFFRKKLIRTRVES